jgi:hypothetical protein
MHLYESMTLNQSFKDAIAFLLQPLRVGSHSARCTLKLILMDIVLEYAEYNDQMAAYNIAMETALMHTECLFHDKKNHYSTSSYD